jgi:hypothetical protein
VRVVASCRACGGWGQALAVCCARCAHLVHGAQPGRGLPRLQRPSTSGVGPRPTGRALLRPAGLVALLPGSGRAAIHGLGTAAVACSLSGTCAEVWSCRVPEGELLVVASLLPGDGASHALYRGQYLLATALAAAPLEARPVLAACSDAERTGRCNGGQVVSCNEDTSREEIAACRLCMADCPATPPTCVSFAVARDAATTMMKTPPGAQQASPE